MNSHLRLTTAITLPFLFITGCASTDNQPFASITDDGKQSTIATQEQDNVNASVKLAINNMDGYLHRLQQEQKHENETTNRIKTENQTTPNEETTDMAVLIVEEKMDFENIVVTPTATASEEIDQLIGAKQSTTPVPDQTKFFFGFNKTLPGDADNKVLKEHAEYLMKNPNVVLVISGHADNRGNKNYNQYLSELRAKNISNILIAAGVPEGQLRVSGMGDNVPMVAANHWDENRRVELLYRDALMLSSQ